MIEHILQVEKLLLRTFLRISLEFFPILVTLKITSISAYVSLWNKYDNRFRENISK